MSFSFRIIRIFIPFAVGFFIASIFRTMNAVLAPEIQSSLAISTTMYAFVTSLYFFGYAPMQLLNGILVDRWGPRRAQSTLFLIGGIGALLFGLAKGPLLLCVGRLLLGAGMAGGLMTAFAANRIWFKNQDLTLINGLTFAVGSLGAISSSYPMHLLLEQINWNRIVLLLAGFNFLLVGIIWISVPDFERRGKKDTWRAEFKELKIIFKDRVFWKIAPLNTLICGTAASFQSYWVSPWIITVENQSSTLTSLVLLSIAFGLVLSNLMGAFLKKSLERQGYSGLWALPICAGFALLSQILIVLQIFPASLTLWFLYTLFSASLMISYSFISAHFPERLVGRSVTALNVLFFGTTFVIQYCFGLIKNIFSSSSEPLGYLVAFWIFITLQILSLIWYAFGKYKPYTQ